MNLPPLLDGLSEISGALTADVSGKLKGATHPETAEHSAAATAAAVGDLSAAGKALGLARLEMLLVKGATRSFVAAIRAEDLLLVAVDPSKGTAQVEKVLHGWVSSAASDGRVPPDAPSARDVEPPPSAAPAAPRPATDPREAATGGDARDPWAALRRSLVRGLLTDAATRRRELDEVGPAAGRPGAEPVAASEIDRAMQLLLQGIGSVLAGDGFGGARTLEALTGASQRNLSFRWLALTWSGRAALKSGDSPAARTHLTQALLLAKQLDVEAVSVSQWVAADVLTHDRDHRRAEACLAAARSGFQQLKDRWGLGQTWLSEARGLVAQRRDDEAISCARQAWAADPSWEEPAVFLARRSLVRNDLAEAEGMLRYLSGPSAERVRSLIDAIRQNIVSPADASEFLRESEAPPTPQSIRAMERIAQGAPRFVQAREALAWMLLKLGKYPDASTIFRGLLGQQLSQADRASVMLGLGCIAHAQQTGKDPDARLHAAVTAGGAAPGKPVSDVAPLPNLSASTLAARSSQIASTGSVFSGQLSVFPLTDVIEFVRSARRTGLLVCSSQKGMAAVHFRDGRITGATSPGTPDLGEVLLRARKISSVALRAVRTSRPGQQPDRVIGEVLLREGIVDAETVRDGVRRQVELTILELVKWKEGEFAFNREGDGDPASTPVPVELDAQAVLLNVLKQMDEDARIPAAPGAQH